MFKRATEFRRSHGISLVYLVAFLVVLSAFTSLAVDLGRVQLAKTELRRAADGAARAGAAGLGTDTFEAARLARQFAMANLVDGSPLELNATQDIVFGRWSPLDQTFTAGGSNINAIHILARRTQERGNAVPMMFASLVGFDLCNVTADAIVMYVPAVEVDQYVPATANPFLAGMPPGSVASGVNPHNNPDRAGSTADPRQSPLAVSMPINGGEFYTFDSIDGTARHDPNLPFFAPDGELADIGHNNLTTRSSNSYGSNTYSENGIADMIAPINSLVGIFLTDDAPDLSGTPDVLDFTSAQSRDFSELKPGLKQIFFIGDGIDAEGNKQKFVAPAGATRLYLATWDFYEWNNNYGFRNIRVSRPAQILTVQ